MKSFRVLYTVFALLLVVTPVAAQVEMADTMRSNGKIYVVVSIILIVLAGLILYLFRIEKKVKKLENRIDEKQR